MGESSENQQEDEIRLEHLPKVVRCGLTVFHWKGFWIGEELWASLKDMNANFNPLPTDVLLTSFPKTGTTWLKALIFTITRFNSKPSDKDDEQEDPLVAHNPHELIPVLEYEIYGTNPIRSLEHSFSLQHPRIFQSHFPHDLLPDSVHASGCKIVYVARNPKDTLVSMWHFWKSRSDGPMATFEELFDAFCEGALPDGPYFEHVLCAWKERERERVFFIRYEELKEEPKMHVKRLAEFLGKSLSEEEVEEVVWRCSLERLSQVKANKGREDVHWSGYGYDSFFRRGVVGDWKNHLTAEMTQRLDEITSEKLHSSGLYFSKCDKK